MAQLEIHGTVVEVKDAFDYIDGDKVDAVEVSINQPQYEAFCARIDQKYYPARVKIITTRLDGFYPEVGQKVVALAQSTTREGKGEHAGKIYVNLKGRSLVLAK